MCNRRRVSNIVNGGYDVWQHCYAGVGKSDLSMRPAQSEQPIHSFVVELWQLQFHNDDYRGSPMKNNLKSKLMRLLEDRSGAVTATAAIWLSIAGVGLAGLGIDGANLYRVKAALQQSSNRAALAGAEQLSRVYRHVAISTAKTYSSDSATPGLNGISAVQSVTATAAASCVWSLLPGDPTSATACPGSGANVITVSQTATVNTFFGFGTKTITASSAAAANGANGYTGNLDVVIILDTTASMAQCENGTNGCSGHTFSDADQLVPAPAPSWANTSSKMQAAELAVQTLLCNFTPASGNTGTQVALMTFPGVSNAFA